MTIPPSLFFFARGLLLSAALTAGLVQAASATNPFLGRWALTLPGDRAGWLEIKAEKDWFDGSVLWGSGSVLPLASVTIADGTLNVTRLRDVARKDAAGATVRTQRLTDTITATANGDALKLVLVAPRADGSGFDRSEFTGRRIPALPPRPDLSKAKFGAPIALFNGRDLSGWRLLESSATNGWVVERGALANRPTQIEGQPPKRYGNLRTDREFEDFNLKLEVNVPPKNNSGVYLRGIYEVQVVDSHSKALDPHNMGALYSRITPKVAAEKTAGEWQSLDITLLSRHLTVVLNGTTIIDNQPVAGVTGGAMWSDESKPGPIYLQGDHGAVDYRNLVLRPIVK